MIPRVAPRGHSFVGAGKYYLHDKQSKTANRVVFTTNHNLPTNDAEKGFRYMAYTAKHADYLKEAAGVATTGRKATKGEVYSYSLAWSPDESPSINDMEQAALSTLEKLGLIDHEAIFVGHNDTDHAHVHVIANLINPEDGRIAKLSYDHLTLSTWAEDYEKTYSQQIYCPERVENNEKRKALAEQGRELGLVKHQQKPYPLSETVSNLYHQSDSGKAFQAALSAEGLTLQRGNRRDFVIVDENGKIHSLSRQLKGVSAATIRDRLAEVEVPQPTNLANTITQAKVRPESGSPLEAEQSRDEKDKSQLLADPELDKALARLEKAMLDKQQRLKTSNQEKEVKKNTDYRLGAKKKGSENPHWLKELDAKREAEQKADRRRDQLKAKLEIYYNVKAVESALKQVSRQLDNLQNQSRAKDLINKLTERKENLQKNLDNIRLRITEQNEALEAKIASQEPANENEAEIRSNDLKQDWSDRLDLSGDEDLSL